MSKKGRDVEMATAAIMLKNMAEPTIRPSVWLFQLTASLRYARTGVKEANAKRLLKTSSNLLMMEAVTAPPRTPISNQGALLFIIAEAEDLIVVYSFPTL